MRTSAFFIITLHKISHIICIDDIMIRLCINIFTNWNVCVLIVVIRAWKIISVDLIVGDELIALDLKLLHNIDDTVLDKWCSLLDFFNIILVNEISDNKNYCLKEPETLVLSTWHNTDDTVPYIGFFSTGLIRTNAC